MGEITIRQTQGERRSRRSDWLGMLATIGIIKGPPFTPDAHTQEILDRAAKTAYKTSRVIGFEEVLNGGSLKMYPDRRCWINFVYPSQPALRL
jgi:hypothetical protein